MKIKNLLLKLLLLNIVLFSYSQTKFMNLNDEIPDWISVIGGNAVAPTVETSYGIAVLSDGRMLSSCTSQGNVIWKKGVTGRPSKYITEHKDFLYVVTNDKKITLVNQSGVNLWVAENDFKITENPVIGYDGRVFVHGTNKLACFGINGLRKWIVETPKISNLPTCILNDGSVVVFLEEEQNGKTIGKRYSQFGMELEDLVFSSRIATVLTCEQGILVALENGSIGLCNVVKKEAGTSWLQKSYINSGAFAICYSDDSKNTAFMFHSGNSTTVILIKTDTGDFLTQFAVGNITPSDLQLAKTTKTGYFLADSKNAFEFAEDGAVFWSATLPSKSEWNFLYYTNSNHLIFCMKNWVLKSYHTMQSPFTVYKNFWDDSYSNDLGEIIEEYEKPDNPNDVYNEQTFTEEEREIGIQAFSDEEIEETIKVLKKGDYGDKECNYISKIKSELRNYRETFYTKNPNRSFFSQNPLYTKRVLEIAAMLGCSDFTDDFYNLLRLEKNPIMLTALVYTSGQHAYDPDGDILTSYEIILRYSTIKNNVPLLKNICDSTFNICKYMGRPALNKHGKDILAQLTSSSFDASVRVYAAKTMEKFSKVKM